NTAIRLYATVFCCLVCDGFITLFYTPQKKYKQNKKKSTSIRRIISTFANEQRKRRF
ncbi:hypothetical protein HMPREF1869_01164, partial [Bacteroidales bacterium KA00251]